MNNSKKVVVITGVITAMIGTGATVYHLSDHQLLPEVKKAPIYAYNYKPSNILDNLFQKDGTNILPFIFESSDDTITKEYIIEQFAKAGLSIKSFSTNEIGTGTKIVTTDNKEYVVLIYGDVDGDGTVDVFDAQRVLRHYVYEGEYLLNGIYQTAANVDNDTEEIDVFDAQKILRFYVGLENKLVLNEPVSSLEADKQAPELRLKGNAVVEVKLRGTYIDSGVTAIDNCDGDISSNVKVTIEKEGKVVSSVDTTKLGNYTITYEVTDRAGNRNHITRIVQIVDYIAYLKVIPPTKTMYRYGEELDLAGAKAQIIMASGEMKPEVVVSKDMISGYDKTAVKNQKVVVTYQGVKNTFDVTVKNYVTGIQITNMPTKTSYIVGETIDTTGMKVEAIMANGNKQDITVKTTLSDTIARKGLTKVTVQYKTVDTLTGKEETFTKEFPIVIVEKVTSIKMIPENVDEITKIPTGYKYLKGTVGTISSQNGEKELTIGDLSYEVTDETGKDITSEGKVVVTFEEELLRPGEILVKVEANENGKYEIKPYIMVDGNKIQTSQTIEIKDDPIIKIVEIPGLNDSEIRQGDTFERQIIFKNQFGDKLQVQKNQIEIYGTGLRITYIRDGATVSSGIVDAIEIRALQEGVTSLKVEINKNDETKKETKEFSLTVLEKLSKKLDVAGTTKVTLYPENTNLPADDTLVVGDVIYSLIPVVIKEGDMETKIRGNELILGEATDSRKFSVSYTDFNAFNPLLNVSMIKDKKVIVTDGNEADYLGIALPNGVGKEELAGKELILTYGDSQIILGLEVASKNITKLEMIPENVDSVSKLPTIYKNQKTTIGTITTGAGEASITTKELSYEVQDEQGNDITAQGKVEVSFEEESLRPGEIQVKVKASEKGTYTILPFILVDGNKIQVTQKIDVIADPIISKVEIDGLVDGTELRKDSITEKQITFRNQYGDILEVNRNQIEIYGTGLEITYLRDGAPTSTGIINGIQIKALTAGVTKLKVEINKEITSKKEIKEFSITVLDKITKEFDVAGTTKVTLYPEDSIPGVNTVVISDVTYTLLPVTLKEGDKVIKIKGNELVLGEATDSRKFSVSYTGFDVWDPLLEVKMIKNGNIITDGTEADYLGIALPYGVGKEDLAGKELILNYEEASVSLAIEVASKNITKLEITPENVDNVSKVPTIYKNQKISIGTITAGAGEMTLKDSDLLYRVENDMGEDITLKGEVLVSFEEESLRPDEIQIKVQARKTGSYKIFPYILIDGGKIETSQLIEVINNPIISSVEISGETSISLRQGEIIEKELTFRNAENDILTVQRDQIEIYGTGLEIVYLRDGAPTTSGIVNGIQIKALTIGVTKLNVVINKQIEAEKLTKQFDITVLEKQQKQLDLGGTTKVTLYPENNNLPHNTIVVGDVIYTLLPVTLKEGDKVIKIKGNELVLGEATESRKFSVSYTGFDVWDPLLEVKMFKNGNIITDGTEADYLGIALPYGVGKSDIAGKSITLQYETAQATLEMDVNEVKESKLMMAPENINAVTKLPTIDKAVETLVGKITSQGGAKELEVSDLSYQVEDENGRNITNEVTNGNKTVAVTFEEISLEPGVIQVKVVAQKIGNYKIIASIVENGKTIQVEQEIEAVYNSTVDNIQISGVSGNSMEMKLGKVVEKDIIFKNAQGDTIEVDASRIAISAVGMEVSYLRDGGPVTSGTVNGLQLKLVKANNTVLNISIDGKKKLEISITQEVEAAKLLSVGASEISLYKTAPVGNTNVVTKNGVTYTLIPISIKQGTDTIKFKGNELILGKPTNERPLGVIDSQFDTWKMASIDAKMFKNGEIVTGNEEADSIGIALADGVEPNELIGETITLTYATSIKTISIK